MKYAFLGCIWLICLAACVERRADIEKMAAIHHSLEHTADLSLASNVEALGLLKERVYKEGSSTEGLRAMEKAKEMHQNALNLISFLDSLRNDLKKSPQSDRAIVRKLFFREQQGEILAQKLDDYQEFILKNYDDLFGGEIKKFFPSFTQSAENAHFTELHFGRSPAIEALAFLEKTRIDVLQYESEVLKKLGAGDWSEGITDYYIHAIAIGTSNSVIQGKDYEADVCLSLTLNREIQVTFNGEDVRVRDGIASIAIPTQGIGEHSWTATIHMQQLEKDTTFHLKGKYQVIPHN